MGNATGRSLVRAQVNKPILYRIFNSIFALLFFVVVIVSVLFNAGHFPADGWAWLLVSGIVGILATWAIAKVFSLLPGPSGLVEKILVPVLLLLFLLLQIVLINTFQISQTGEYPFGEIFILANENVLNGSLPGEYFSQYPGSAGLYFLWVGYFSLLKLAGITGFLFPAMILNAVVIDISLLLLYFAARTVFGSGKALFILLVSFATLPFLLHTAIPSAATMVLPIPIAGVLLWLNIRKKWRMNKVGECVAKFCLLSALLAMGALLKASVLIVWVGIVVDMFLLLCGKARIRIFLAGLLTLVLLYLLGNFGIWLSPAVPTYERGKSIPFTYWIMAGLGENGILSPEEESILADATTREEKQAAISAETTKRVNSMGFLGMTTHLLNKLGYLYGDGTLDAQMILGDTMDPSSGLYAFFSDKGVHAYKIAYGMFGLELSFIFWAIVAAIKATLRKNDCLTFVRVILFGYTIFLLVWESSVLHLVSVLPLLLLAALEATSSWNKQGKASEEEPMEERREEWDALVEPEDYIIELPTEEPVSEKVPNYILAYAEEKQQGNRSVEEKVNTPVVKTTDESIDEILASVRKTAEKSEARQPENVFLEELPSEKLEQPVPQKSDNGENTSSELSLWDLV